VKPIGVGLSRAERLDHGERDGLHPRIIVLHIGTNNTSDTEHARKNTPAEITEGVRAIWRRLRAKAPEARIILILHAHSHCLTTFPGSLTMAVMSSESSIVQVFNEVE
jgi:lysophospholipase L1-like esterase